MRLTFALRVYLLTALATLGIGLVIATAIIGSNRMEDAGRRLHEVGVRGVEEASRLALLFEQQASLVTRAPAEIDLRRQQEFRTEFHDRSGEIDESVARLEGLVPTRLRVKTNALAADFAAVRESAATVFERSANFLQDEAAAVVTGPFAAAELRIKANLQYLHQAMKDAAQADADELAAARVTLLATIGAMSAIAVVIVIGFGAYLTYRLSSRVRRITAVMNAVSKGGGDDIQIPFTEDRSELGEMARALEVFHRYGAEIASLREFLNTVIDNVPTSIIVKDATNHRIILINRAVEELWGLQRAQVLGKTMHDLFPKARADIVRGRDEEVIRSDKSLDIMDAHPLAGYSENSGAPFITSRRLCIRGRDGNPAYLLTVIEDITERRAVERQLRQAQKMEAVGKLSGGLAHDFNNLLLVMVGNLDQLIEELVDRPHAAEKADAVLKAALRGAELTQQMLAFSRQQPLQPQRVDVNALLDDTMRMIKRTLGGSIEIEVRAAIGLPPIFVDAAQLEVALVNIAINARDAMPHGGKLIVESSAIQLSAEHKPSYPELVPGRYVVLGLTDNGIGMPADVLSRIFEPFFTTKGPGEGTGLGLSMVYGFIKQSGGHIGAYSEVGRGSAFKLYLPVDRDSNDVSDLAAIADEAPLAHDGEVVLAVDDNADVRAAVAAYLRELGYRVETAENAEMAMQKIRTPAKIDLLFTDVIMPGGINGKELAEAARQVRPDLKVLFTSGFPGDSLGNVELEAGAALLGKPYRRIDLARKLRAVLAGSQGG
jgi:PAS domain S-box-containing protein